MSSAPTQSGLRERVARAIVEAAGTVLAERGEQASMQDVARAAGVARATLYRYFPTREALLEALGALAREETGEALRAARLDQVPLQEAFSRAVRALVGVGDAFVVLAREQRQADAAGFERRVAGPLRALIERGQGEGEIRDDVPAAWLLESLLALVVSVLPSAPALGPEDAVGTITSLFLDGAHGTGPGTRPRP
jgi:TetR/AcrR family transcriptional regulator, mexCD-oprJ operon repressor